MRRWEPEQVVPMHHHLGYDEHILVLWGRLEEYIEHMDGTDDETIYESGDWFSTDNADGEHALRARTPVVTLEVYRVYDKEEFMTNMCEIGGQNTTSDTSNVFLLYMQQCVC